MVTLDRLPNEVLHSIASFLIKKYDLAALSRVNRHCYHIASPILWRREVESDRPGAIHWAVDHGDIKLLERVLEAGIDPSRTAFAHRPKTRIDAKFKWWNYHSTYYDDPEWLLGDDEESVDLDRNYVSHNECNCFSSGCDDGIFNDCTWDPIHIAASKGRTDMIQILLDKGANVDAPSWGFCLCRPHLPIEAFNESRNIEEDDLHDLHGGGWTPLHIAICHGQLETAKFLLTKGASEVIYQGVNLQLDAAAWREGEAPQDASRFRLTAMHHAAKHGYVELLQYLLDNKYQEEINAEGPFLGTPLIQAIWHGHWDDVVPWLVEHGANIDGELIETRLTPLMMACFSRRFDDADRLIDLGAKVTTLTVHQFSIIHLMLGASPVRYDEWGKCIERPKSTITEAQIIEKFIASGFPVDAREAVLGMTPLMVASAHCNLPAMKVLLAGGADPSAVDHEGFTPLSRIGEGAEDPTMTGGLYEAGKLLLEAGAALKDNSDDMTPLNIICARDCESVSIPEWEEQYAELAKLLIEKGVDPNEKGISPHRPFTESVLRSNFRLAEAILESGGRPEPGDLEQVLDRNVDDLFDNGKTRFIVGLNYAKYGVDGPSDVFLVDLTQRALKEQRWNMVAELMKVVTLPKEMREGLMHRCLKNGSLTGDDPSILVQMLLDEGADPNSLWEGELPIYYSLKSGYCWLSTPVLVNAGADVDKPTPSMPDGAFMFAITNGYQAQWLQMLAKHPTLLQDRTEAQHRECWESVVRWEQRMEPRGRVNPRVMPFLQWNLANKLLAAGLRTDIELRNGRTVREIVEEATPRVTCRSGREVLGYFDIEPDDQFLDDLEAGYDLGILTEDEENFSDDSQDEDEWGLGGEDHEDEDEEDDEEDGHGYGFWGEDDEDDEDEDDDDDFYPMPFQAMSLSFGLF